MLKGGNVIILVNEGQHEVWGSLAEICRTYKFSYGYLSRKKFPFKYRNLQFIKKKFRTQYFENTPNH